MLSNSFLCDKDTAPTKPSSHFLSLKNLSGVTLQVGHRDFDVERKLRRDLKRTHALLADAQLLLATLDSSGQNRPKGSKDQIERLHCQVRGAVSAELHRESPGALRVHPLCLRSAGGERGEAAGGGEHAESRRHGAGERPVGTGEYLQAEECGE